MQVFGGLISPYVRKVALVLEEKALPYELIQLSPHTEHSEFRAASPFGKIPALADGDYHLADSSAIVAYIEATHPAAPLLPAEPRARGKAMWFDEFADTILFGAGIKILFHRFVGPKLLKVPVDEAIAAQGEAEMPAIRAWLESVAPAEGWLLGETFSLADYAVASALRSLVPVGWGPRPDDYPRTAAWYARVAARPGWQAVAAIEDRPRH